MRVDGSVVGASGLSADDFAVLRSFETGSWLGLAHQGAGLGTELRAATLHLGFAGFGAHVATTAAFDDNPASLGVTNRLGYEPTGTRRVVRRGAPATIRDFRMSREHWESIRRDDITLHGIDAVVDLLEIPAF